MTDTDIINDLLADASLDAFDIPDVEIEYQEDDGNSTCEGGACTI